MFMKTLALIFVLVISLSAMSQISYDKRLEFNLNDGYDKEKIYEFGEKGFVMTSVGDVVSFSDRYYRYELFDKNLELFKSDSVLLDKKLRADETVSTKDYLHTFYKDAKGNFSLVSISADDLAVVKVDGELPKKVYVSDMAVLGDYAYFKSNIKRTPYLFSINWKTGKQTPILLSLNKVRSKDIQLVGFQLLEDSDEIMLYARVKAGKKKYDMYVICLDGNGKKTDVYNLTAGIDENIIDVSSYNAGGGKYIFTGTYSVNNAFFSEGIFFCKANGSTIEDIEFCPYAGLKNFLSYLPEKQQKRIEKRKKRKESNGNEFVLNYSIAAHDIIVREDGYLMLGEAYYPTYRTETETVTTTVNGVTTTSTHTKSVFDGYQYTHAVLVKFGLDGRKQWDQSFEMWALYKPYHVKRFISVSVDDDKLIKMVFANSSKIVSKIVDNDGYVIQDKVYDEIKTSYSDDVTKRSFSNIDYWYGNYFIAYGSQRIKNVEDENVKRKRNVFFISKIRFE